MPEIHIIYQANCIDGFGAAWAAHEHLGRNHEEQQVHYIPSSYGDRPPETGPEDKVFILDFSYPLETMLELHQRHQGRVTLLAHHKSTQDELEGRAPNCHFDQERSGAVMAWEFFSKDKNPHTVPLILQYVQDHALRRWKMWESRAINAALESHAKDFNVWRTLTLTGMVEEGRGILRRERTMIEKITGLTVLRNVGGYRVPAVNTPVLVPETCEAMLELQPDAPFAAAYSAYPGPDGTLRERWSLRSRPGFDVLEIAKRMGGGGHPQSAVFTRPAEESVPANPRR